MFSWQLAIHEYLHLICKTLLLQNSVRDSFFNLEKFKPTEIFFSTRFNMVPMFDPKEKYTYSGRLIQEERIFMMKAGMPNCHQEIP